MPRRATQPADRSAALAVVCASLVALAMPPGAASSQTRTVSRCVGASRLLGGSRAGAVAAALRQAPRFAVRVAGRAGPTDLNYALLSSTCSRAMIARTWYTDLHPPGMQCHACDSHEYWVLLRRGGWATLGYFSG